MTATPASPATAPRRAARPSMGWPYPAGEVLERSRRRAPVRAGARWNGAPSRGSPRAERGVRGTGCSPCERLLHLEAGDGLEVAEDGGELLGGPRLAAVAAALGEADQTDGATGLVLGDGEVTGGRVAVAGTGSGAEAQTPAGDDDGVPVVADLAHLEDGRLVTPAHGVLPSTAPGKEGSRAVTGSSELSEVSAGPRLRVKRLRCSSSATERNPAHTARPRHFPPGCGRS